MRNLNMGTEEATTIEETEDVQGEKIKVPAMRADGRSLVERAKAFVVSSVETMQQAQTIAQECARRKKVIDERFKTVREKTKAAKLAADKANSSVIALIDELKKPYDDAIAILDPKARDWQRAENKRLADEAEKKRQEEQKKLDDARAKEIEDAKKMDPKLAVELAEKPPEIAVVQPEKVESAAGTSNRAHWKAICHDLPALVKAIAAGRAPISLVLFNQSEGDAQARTNHDAVVYDGVAFQDVGSTAHRV